MSSGNPDYWTKGYVALPGFVPADAARGFVLRMKGDFARSGVSFGSLKQASPLLKEAAVEIYGYHYVPMIGFLWGMTPAVSALIGRDVLPTYSYFRIYRKGDICRVHVDRPSCEHSISLLLASSDGLPWALEVGERLPEPRQMADDSFGERPFSGVDMQPGDAVLYQGTHHLHGRTKPNPNRWSAHMFLHWVDADGPYADQAYDGQQVPEGLDFDFA